MSQQIINNNSIQQVDFIQGRTGEFRAIIKGSSGIVSVSPDLGILCNWESGPRWKSAIQVFRGFKKGVLQSIEFKPANSNNWFTVFARNGKKIILMDTDLFLAMEVGDINQNWTNTELYSMANYTQAGAKTWADKAFVPNLQPAE